MLLGAIAIFGRCLVSNMWMIIIPGLLYSFADSAIYILGYSTIRDIYDPQKTGVYRNFLPSSFTPIQKQSRLPMEAALRGLK